MHGISSHSAYTVSSGGEDCMPFTTERPKEVDPNDSLRAAEFRIYQEVTNRVGEQMAENSSRIEHVAGGKDPDTNPETLYNLRQLL